MPSFGRRWTTCRCPPGPGRRSQDEQEQGYTATGAYSRTDHDTTFSGTASASDSLVIDQSLVVAYTWDSEGQWILGVPAGPLSDLGIVSSSTSLIEATQIQNSQLPLEVTWQSTSATVGHGFHFLTLSSTMDIEVTEPDEPHAEAPDLDGQPWLHVVGLYQWQRAKRRRPSDNDHLRPQHLGTDAARFPAQRPQRVHL